MEEWIARHPQAIFADNRMPILASQNHAHLEEKIDFLFIDACGRFHISELKIVDVAENGGVVPYAIYNEQMQKYVSFINGCRASFPDSMIDAYSRFSEEFYGAARLLPHDLQAAFGKSCCAPNDHAVVEVYVASGYDDYAVDYLASQSLAHGRCVRLVYYRFYPDIHGIEFWEVPMQTNGAEPANPVSQRPTETA